MGQLQRSKAEHKDRVAMGVRVVVRWTEVLVHMTERMQPVQVLQLVAVVPAVAVEKPPVQRMSEHMAQVVRVAATEKV